MWGIGLPFACKGHDLPYCGDTFNLQEPLVLNAIRRVGRQLVLTSSRYPVRYPLDTGIGAPAPNLLPGPSPLRATA